MSFLRYKPGDTVAVYLKINDRMMSRNLYVTREGLVEKIGGDQEVVDGTVGFCLHCNLPIFNIFEAGGPVAMCDHDFPNDHVHKPADCAPFNGETECPYRQRGESCPLDGAVHNACYEDLFSAQVDSIAR